MRGQGLPIEISPNMQLYLLHALSMSDRECIEIYTYVCMCVANFVHSLNHQELLLLFLAAVRIADDGSYI